METKLIECKLIDVPKVDGSIRTFSKEFAVKLADSLKLEGQLNPIVLRPNPDAVGRYILVCGRHRLYAMKKVMREQFIRATVIEDMDETEAGIAADAENLWRNPLSKPQHALAIKRWHMNWLAKLPVIAPKAAAEESSAVATVADEASGQSDQKALEAPVTEEAAPVAEAASEAKFNEAVAAVTGQSAVTIRRSKAIANAFTEEQLEVFVQMEVNQTDMMTIAKIKDVVKRGEVVNLIASGMVVEDAIKEVMKDAAPTRYNNDAEEVAAKKEAKKEKEPTLSDDEWFDKFCGEKAAMLGNPARFKSDALLFRAISDPRHAFRSKAKKFLAATKKAGNYGAFYNLVNRFVSISHPKDWLICPECKGTGDHPSLPEAAGKGKCPKCFSGGYLLKTEEYL